MHPNTPARIARTPRRFATTTALAAAAALTFARGAAAQTLTELSPLSGDTGSNAVGVSANGVFVAGTSWSPAGLRSFRAGPERRIEGIDTLPGSSTTWAWSISGNGDAVAGSAYFDSGESRAVRWTRGRGLEDLGAFPGSLYGGFATGASFTGDQITGVCTTSEGAYHAFRWTPRGLRDLGVAPGGTYSYGYAISGDGEVVTGMGDSSSGDGAIRWSAREGMRPLPTVAPGDWSIGYAINRDGSAIAGGSGSNAVLWRDGAVRDLGTLPGGTFSFAYAISGDGRVVAGLCDDARGAIVACLWTEHLGMVDLREHLTALGVDLTGWTLDAAAALSADGSIVAGQGTHDGQSRGWVARVRSIEGDRGDPRGRGPNPHVHRSASPFASRVPGWRGR
ncbi:MAG: hypothetical protein U0326_40835 [Polyangiales bacterium]